MSWFEPFILRALAAGIMLSVVAAPSGCLMIWRRMSYFGATIAHAGLLGVALGLLLSMDPTVGVVVVSVLLGLLLVVLERQPFLPVDSLLGLLSHAALALGLIAASLLAGQRLDLMGYLFGDILAVSTMDLVWIGVGALVILAVLARHWSDLVAMAVNDEIAAAEGIDVGRLHLTFVVLLSLLIAVAMKIVGILLVVAFLIMPAMAARPFSSTPEQMVVRAAIAGAMGTLAGMALSWHLDVPGGPAIVVALSGLAGLGLAKSAATRS